MRHGTSRKHQRPWQPHEDAVVIERYAAQGPLACLGLLPGRNEDQVRGRAHSLGIYRTTPKSRFTEPEEHLLVRNYSTLGPAGCHHLIPRKSPHAIKCKAHRMGLRFHGHPLSAKRPMPPALERAAA